MKIIITLFISLSWLVAGHTNEKIKSYYLKSYNYEKMGQYSEAIKVLTPLYQKYPKGYTINLRFGWLFYLEKKYNDALHYYQKASLINTHSLDSKLGMAMVYLTTNQYKKSESISNEILKIDYYDYYANLYVTKALIAQEKYEIAKNIIQKILTLHPTDVLYLEQLAIVYQKTNHAYLHTLYEDILILDPNNTLVKNQKR